MLPTTRRRLLALVLAPLALAACAQAVDNGSESSDDALSLTNFQNLLLNKIDRSKPDPSNEWAKKDLALAEENFLDGEDAMFTGFAQTVRQIQDANKTSSSTGAPERGFHAKPHACMLGEMQVDPSALADADRVGLFATKATYPTYVRFSNGVGTRQADKKVDVRGLALKVMNVPGPKVLTKDGEADAATQDFLMTNGAITPACDSKHFVDFGFATAKAAESGSILGRLENMSKAGGFLLKDDNVRTLDFLIHHSLPNVKSAGSVLGDQFWSGGAIALGLTDGGDPMHARARRAMKFHVVPGVLDGDACTPVPIKPNTSSDGYLRDDLKSHVSQSGMCADFFVQFQEDPAAQPLEDTSVEWKTAEVKVARIVVNAIDLDDSKAQADEATCNGYAFTPWHALVEHRPLGNIMRARRAVYAGSAEYRNAQPEPTSN